MPIIMINTEVGIVELIAIFFKRATLSTTVVSIAFTLLLSISMDKQPLTLPFSKLWSQPFLYGRPSALRLKLPISDDDLTKYEKFSSLLSFSVILLAILSRKLK